MGQLFGDPDEERRKRTTSSQLFTTPDETELRKFKKREVEERAKRVKKETEKKVKERKEPSFLERAKGVVSDISRRADDLIRGRPKLISPIPLEKDRDIGYTETIGRQFKAGIGDLLVTAGGTSRWLGAEGVAEKLTQPGVRYQSSQVPRTTGEFDWKDLYDPSFYSQTVTRSLPFTLSLVPVAIIGGYGAATIAGAVGIGALGTAVLGSFGAAALSRPMESALEAGIVYDQSIQEGRTPEEADKAADKTFEANMKLAGLDFAEFIVAFAPIKGGRAFTRAIKRTAGVTASIALEGGEEVIQRNIQLASMDKELDFTSKQAQEEFAIGGIMGGGMGVAGAVYNKIQNNVEDQYPEEYQKTYTEKRNDGLSHREARSQTLDEITEAHPKEVKEVVESTLEETIPIPEEEVKAPKEEAKPKAPKKKVKDEAIEITHYGKEAVEELDPKYFGKGKPAEELKRKVAFPDEWVDRINVYFGKHEAEAGLGAEKFTTSLKKSEILNIDSKEFTDLMTQAREESVSKGLATDIPNVEAEITILEKLAKEEGYKGVQFKNNQGILFDKTKAYNPTVIVKLTKEEGSSTTSTKGEAPQRYVVSGYKERNLQVPIKKLTKKVVDDYKNKNADLLKKENHFLGTWNDDGTVHLDVVISTENLKEAQAKGKELGEKAIYDSKTDKDIQVTGVAVKKKVGKQILNRKVATEWFDNFEEVSPQTISWNGGYITPDGRYVIAGEHHDEIMEKMMKELNAKLPKIQYKGSGSRRFDRVTGAIRIIVTPKEVDIDLATKITETQAKKIREILIANKNKKFNYDLSDPITGKYITYGSDVNEFYANIKKHKDKFIIKKVTGVKEEKAIPKELEPLAKEARKFKTAASFEANRRPIEVVSIYKKRGVYDTNPNSISIKMFPKKSVQGKGITKDYLLSTLRDAKLKHNVTRVNWSTGLSERGKGFIKSLENNGYLRDTKHGSSFITDKVNTYKTKFNFADFFNQAKGVEKAKVSKVAEEFKVGDILDPQGNTNMVGKVKIREITGNTLKFVDSTGKEFAGMAQATVRRLVEGGSWKRVTPTKEVKKPKVPKKKAKVTKITPKKKAVPRAQLPVGEGAKKVSKLEARIKKSLDATSQDVIDEMGLSTFQQVTKKENIRKASEYVTKNPDEALQVLSGDKEAPSGLLYNSIFIAMQNLAKGNVDLARKLSSLRSTRFAQEISILSEVDPNSPVKLMQEIIKIREKVFKKKHPKKSLSKAKKKIAKDIKSKVKKPDKFDWNAFISSIEC